MITTATTFDGMDGKLTSRRRDGNTTRLVDNTIQLLFQGHSVKVLDHYESGANNKANRHLLDAIIKRLQTEHRWIMTQLMVDVNKSIPAIKLVENPTPNKP